MPPRRRGAARRPVAVVAAAPAGAPVVAAAPPPGPAAGGLGVHRTEDDTWLDDGSWRTHPIVRAVCTGEVAELEKVFLSQEVNVNGLTSSGAEGITLLHLAAQHDQHAVVAWLCERGAHVDCIDGNGKTPLMYAVWHKAGQKTLETLLNNGANVNAKSVRGYSVFHLAIRAGSTSTIGRLRKYSPNVNTASIEGITPLHDAIELPASVGTPIIDAILRCRTVNPKTKEAFIPRSRTDTTDLVTMRASLRESAGTRLTLTRHTARQSPLMRRSTTNTSSFGSLESPLQAVAAASSSSAPLRRRLVYADDDVGAGDRAAGDGSRSHDHTHGGGGDESSDAEAVVTTRRRPAARFPAQRRGSGTAGGSSPAGASAQHTPAMRATAAAPAGGRRDGRTTHADPQAEHDDDNVPPPPEGPPPADALASPTVTRTGPDAAPTPDTLRTGGLPRQQMSSAATPVTAATPATGRQGKAAPHVGSDDDSDDDGVDDALDEVDVLCGRCQATFGTCSCVLSNAPCYVPGRWACPMGDQLTPMGRSPLALAAAHGRSHATVTSMLLQLEAHTTLEGLLA